MACLSLLLAIAIIRTLPQRRPSKPIASSKRPVSQSSHQPCTVTQPYHSLGIGDAITLIITYAQHCVLLLFYTVLVLVDFNVQIQAEYVAKRATDQFQVCLLTYVWDGGGTYNQRSAPTRPKAVFLRDALQDVCCFKKKEDTLSQSR